MGRGGDMAEIATRERTLFYGGGGAEARAGAPNMASGKCIRGIEIDFFRKETIMILQSGGNSSPSAKALVQESPVFPLTSRC